MTITGLYFEKHAPLPRTTPQGRRAVDRLTLLATLGAALLSLFSTAQTLNPPTTVRGMGHEE
jgi:hypothetical protein